MGVLDRVFWEGRTDPAGFDIQTGAEALYRLDEHPPGADCVAFGVDFDNFARFRGAEARVRCGDGLACAFVRTRQAAGWRVLRCSPRGDEYLLLAPFPMAVLVNETQRALQAILEPAVKAGTERLRFTVGAVALAPGEWPVPRVRAAFALCEQLKETGRRGCVAWREPGGVRIWGSASSAADGYVVRV